jgi:hypothetical protein
LPFESRLTFGTARASVIRASMPHDPEQPPAEPEANEPSRLPPYAPRSVAQRWLARLSFSFFIIALWLAWTAMHLPPGAGWRKHLYFAGAAASLAVGLAGVRARHRGDAGEPWN